jgi:hypothetical protein
MRLFTYVIARDYGFAPNPFGGVCTLATCKPDIRRLASIGDWVVGIASRADKVNPSLAYVMRIDEAMTYEAYWEDPRFEHKKPLRRSSLRHAYGDNIYSKDGVGQWRQADSHHSLEDGSINPRNVVNDTQTNRVLIGWQFAYWGANALPIPTVFSGAGDETILLTRGHRSHFSSSFVDSFVTWFESLQEQGCVGEPAQWKKPRSTWARPRFGRATKHAG